MILKSTAAAVRDDLSRQAVIDRALDVCDAEGLDAVTIRRLATDFGVTPMALYWHVKNKDELLAAVGDRIFEGMAAQTEQAIDAAGRKWPAQLRAVMQVLLERLRAHPRAVALAMPRILMNDDGRITTERTLDILRGGGLSVVQSADVARQALMSAVMLVSTLASGEPGAEPAQHEAALVAKRAALEGLPAEKFPRLIETASALTDCEDEEAYYDAGIDLYVAGVESLARSASRAAAGRTQGQ